MNQELKSATVLTDPPAEWTSSMAEQLYNLAAWGDGYFVIDQDGRIKVSPARNGSEHVAIIDVVQQLKDRKIPFPVLIRFQDVLRCRVAQINEAFRQAISELGYANRYVGVYPIKVNQLHEVVEEVLDAGKAYDLGLECGSKAELIAALPHLTSDDTLLICNGYKDHDMLQLMLSFQQLGKQVIPVIEKLDEFEDLTQIAALRGVSSRFGVRVRLSSAGAGKWAESGGDLSKFGVSIPELLNILEEIEREGQVDSFRLLHFHLGSQISDIQALRRAVKEIAQIYVQIRKRGVPVEYLDVGGGLGVNYEGDLAGAGQSINYSLQEYANAVVQAVREVCDVESVPHPIIVSESGRALTAHHSVLVLEVLGSYKKEEVDESFLPSESDHRTVQEMHHTLKWMLSEESPRPPELLEAYHDILHKRQEADALFSFGYLPLEQKALTDQLFWTACRAIQRHVHSVEAEWLPDELVALGNSLVDQYLCNFSVFQSMLDHWAIGQCFPIVPLQRLDEQPSRKAVLMDLTCDSDGKVSQYVTANDNSSYVDLHPLRPGEPYFIGVFLMGAYQDIMGDTHNLFGRVAEAHVYADASEPSGFYVEKIIPSTNIEGMLALVQYFPNDLQKRMEGLVKAKVEEGVIRPTAGVKLVEDFLDCFGDSTYLQR